MKRMSDLKHFINFTLLKQLMPYKNCLYIDELSIIVARIHWAYETNHYWIYEQYRIFVWILIFKILQHFYFYIVDKGDIDYYLSNEMLNGLLLKGKINLIMSSLLLMTLYYYKELYLNRNLILFQLYQSCLINLDNHLFYWPFKYKNQQAPLFVRRIVLYIFNFLQIFIVALGAQILFFNFRLFKTEYYILLFCKYSFCVIFVYSFLFNHFEFFYI